MKPKKGQMMALSTILMLAIVIVLVVAAYFWGSSLLQTQEDTATSSYVRGKMLEIKRNVIEVTHEGINSTRTVQVDLSRGELSVLGGAYCPGSAIGKNGLVYNITTSTKLIQATNESWVLIDPRENSTKCDESYEENGPGVLLGRSRPHGSGSYSNEYFLWFRKLTDDDSNEFLISILPGQSSAASGGTGTVVLRNTGVSGTTTNVTVTVI